MFKNRRVMATALICLAALSVMAFVEKDLQPGYWIKSIIKLIVFPGQVLVFSMVCKEDLSALIGLKVKRPSKTLLLFTLFAYAGIIVLYLILKDQIDMEGIREKLLAKEGLDRNNFIFIFSYIILVNSFLEESFFRGFLYQVFRKEGYAGAGIIFSAAAFSAYHISIMDSWFTPAVAALAIGGLFLTGIFLQYICLKEDSLLGSWLVHGSANLAINTIAVMMLFS